MKAIWMLAAAATAAAALAAPADAATFTYTGEVTLDPGQVNAAGFFVAPLPGANFELQPGDQVVGTIRFANNERLTVFDDPARFGDESISASFGRVGNSSFFWTVTGVQGEYLRPLYQEGGCSDLCFSTFGDLTTSSFSFTGADFRILYRGDGPSIFDPSALVVGGARLGFGDQAGAVPEPATWAMLIIGFGLVGGVLRRRPAATGAAIA